MPKKRKITENSDSDSEPLSKRRKVTKKEDVEDGQLDSDSIDENVDEWDENLYGDEQDRQHLNSMPELQREQILFERGRKRQEIHERREAVRLLKQQGGAKGVDDDIFNVSDSDSDVEPLANIIEQTEEIEKPKFTLKEESDSEDEFIPRTKLEPERPLHQQPTSQAPGIGSTSRSSSSAGGRETNLTLKTLRKAQIRRENLEKCHHEPWMKRFVLNLFVKLCLGEQTDAPGVPLYRICEICGVEKYRRTYGFGGRSTNKGLVLRLPGNKKRVFKMQLISNQSFTQEEFDNWIEEQRRMRRRLPAGEEVQDLVLKRRQYRKKFVYTEDELRTMEYKKKSERFRDLTKVSNILQTKLEIEIELQKAKFGGDTQLMHRLQRIFSKIEQEEERRKRLSQKDTIEKINKINQDKIRQKQRLIQMRQRKQQESGYDPKDYRRIMTRVQVERFDQEEEPVKVATKEEKKKKPRQEVEEQEKTVLQIEVTQVANPEEISLQTKDDVYWNKFSKLYQQFTQSFTFKPSSKRPEPFLAIVTGSKTHYSDEHTKVPDGSNIRIVPFEDYSRVH